MIEMHTNHKNTSNISLKSVGSNFQNPTPIIAFILAVAAVACLVSAHGIDQLIPQLTYAQEDKSLVKEEETFNEEQGNENGNRNEVQSNSNGISQRLEYATVP